MTGHSPLSRIIVTLSGVERSSTPLGLTKFAAFKIIPSLVEK
ncbi:hypothetical protein Aconfl_34990 [Algoriphagus confluentis]|uniref:Uncharacterized protein n=1 Tax=Algoriphagus confluentis TaxID=1697556 RepID=A0ABQ6PT92_9BACT|nr:hypothetical protein Aconfl_34990 [Algoriphagus confluentis]